MITLPAACLTQLGGLQDEDPPVLWLDPDGQVIACLHPLQQPALAVGRLLLPQSYAALARVLARTRGAELEPWEVPFLDSTTTIVELLWNDGGHDPYEHWAPPALTPEMPTMRAFAEAFVWAARVARAWGPPPHNPECEPDVADVEREIGLVEWRVEVTT